MPCRGFAAALGDIVGFHSRKPALAHWEMSIPRLLQPFEMRFLCVCARWKLYPRVLRDVSVMDLSTSVLGQRVTVPVCVAATAMQRMAHPHGETATARGEPCLGQDRDRDRAVPAAWAAQLGSVLLPGFELLLRGNRADPRVCFLPFHSSECGFSLHGLGGKMKDAKGE